MKKFLCGVAGIIFSAISAQPSSALTVLDTIGTDVFAANPAFWQLTNNSGNGESIAVKFSSPVDLNITNVDAFVKSFSGSLTVNIGIG